MHHKLTKLVIIIAILILLTPSYAFARLIIPTPDQMLDEANTIVVATVTKLTYGEDKRPVGEFKVKKVLKGDLEGTFTVSPESCVTGGYLQQIPPVNTEVMVLLSKDDSGTVSFPEMYNNIGILKDGRVLAVEGINTNLQPFVAVYDEFFQERSKQQKVLVNAAKTTTTTLARDVIVISKDPIPNWLALLISFVALGWTVRRDLIRLNVACNLSDDIILSNGEHVNHGLLMFDITNVNPQKPITITKIGCTIHNEDIEYWLNTGHEMQPEKLGPGSFLRLVTVAHRDHINDIKCLWVMDSLGKKYKVRGRTLRKLKEKSKTLAQPST